MGKREYTELENLLIFSNYIPNVVGNGKYHSIFRGERVASMDIDISRGIWYDFGMGCGGDVIKLVMMAEGMGYNAAIEYIERILLGGNGRELRDWGVRCGRNIGGSKLPREEDLVRVYGTGGWYYWDIVGRGLSWEFVTGVGVSVIELWGREWMKFSYGGGKYKLVHKDGRGRRVMTNGGGLGLYVPYGIELSGDIILCEGELDALCVYACGYRGVSVPQGSMSFRGWMLDGMGVEMVYVIFDADEAGRGGMNRVREELMRGGYRYRLIDWRELGIEIWEGYDVSDYYKRYGNIEEIVGRYGIRV